MPANLNDDVILQEKDGIYKVIENTNQKVNSSDISKYAVMKQDFHPFSMVRDGESFRQEQKLEHGVLTKDMALSEVRKSHSITETSSDKVVIADVQRTNKLDQPDLLPSHEAIIDVHVAQNAARIHCRHQNMNSITVNSNIFKRKDLENNSDAVTCNVQNLYLTERHMKRNTAFSTAFKNEGYMSQLSSDPKLNSESESTFRNLTCINKFIDESGTEIKLSNSEERSVESDTPDINTELGSSFEDPAIPKYFSNYIEGLRICGDSHCPLDSKPSWFDEKKYRRGQKIAMKYFFGIQFAQLLSLLVVLNNPGGVEPLIFTGKSDTPFKAFKRYLSTALRVRSWYLDDLWNTQTEGHKNLKMVRAMHGNLRKNLEATDPKERDKKSTLSGRHDVGCPAIWSTLQNKLREDFEEACPFPRITENEFKKFYKTRACVNQTEMSITQFGFVGLFIKYPAYFGAHSITDEELDSFVHLWRCIGYLLGVEDKYNFCNGDLQTIRQKTNDLIEFICKPNFRRITQDWEHMTRCITEGISYYVPGVTFEVSLMYLCNMFGLCTPRLWAALTVRQKILYYLTHFIFWFVFRLPGSLNYFNLVVEKHLKFGENASPTKLKEWEEKKYPYQENAVYT